jgi:magnesium transporter
MIQVTVILPDNSLHCGGHELLDAPQPEGAQVWIDVEGHTPDNEQLITAMQFHPLAIEDTFTLQHQPRFEEYENHLFVIVRGIDFNKKSDRLDTLKLAAFLTKDRLVTFHRAPMRSVNAVRERFKEVGRAPRGGLPHLLYLIYDELISLYQPLVDEVGSEVEVLEEEIFREPRQEHLVTIQRLKQRLSTIRRVMLPHRQVFNHLATGSAEEISDSEALYFRDVYDDIVRLTESVDVMRELLSSARDTYMSVVGQRTNEIMKVLTVISAVLLPLTVITGIYGMNFEHMPELASRGGYPAVVGTMVLVAGGMLLWFRRKGWI